MGHHLGPARLPDGQGFYVLTLVVSERVDYVGRVPGTLSGSLRQDFTGTPTGLIFNSTVRRQAFGTRQSELLWSWKPHVVQDKVSDREYFAKGQETRHRQQLDLEVAAVWQQ